MAKLILDFYEGESNYTDGESIEAEMLKLAESGVDDVSQMNRAEWPFFYHFSHLRENILNWYSFSRGCKILEVGSGCGALTGLLCDKASYVASIELTYQRAAINHARHKSKKNLDIFVGNLSNIKLDEKFDYIIVNGVLEYAGQFIEGDKPHEEFLEMLSPFLNENGSLLLSIENRLGMKYFSGAKEDHLGELFVGLDSYRYANGIRTFSKTELTQLVENVGLNIEKFYYPYPDYKFPEVIFTDKGFKLASLSYDSSSYDMDRYMFFDENKMQQLLVKEEASDIFANSFLVELSKPGKAQEKKEKNILFTKINANRDTPYQIFTSIIETNEEIRVEKRPLHEDAFEHLKRMKNFYEKSLSTSQLELLPLELGEDHVSYPYVQESVFESYLIEVIEQKKIELFFDSIEKFKQMIYKSDSGFNLYSSGFEEAFGNVRPEEKLLFVDMDNFDILFDNVFYKDSKFIVFDYEWCLGFKLPAKFIFWRSIKEFYEKNRNVEKSIGIDQLYKKYEIIPETVSVFYEWEKHFSLQHIGMTDRSVYKKQTIYLNDSSEIFNEKDYQANLYVDTGTGFNEKNKVQVNYEPNEKGEVQIHFNLEKFQNIKALRFDPLEGEMVLCAINSSKLKGQKIEWQPFNSFTFGENSQDLFLNRDPIYISNSVFDFEDQKELLICFVIKKLTDKEIYSEIIERITSIKNQAITHQKELIAQNNKDVLRLSEQIEKTEKEAEKLSLDNQRLELENNQFEQTNAELKDVLSKVASEYQTVINSKAWRSTKPIRISMDLAKSANKRIRNNTREGKMLLNKVNQNFKNNGFKKTVVKINNKAPEIFIKVKKSNQIVDSLNAGDAWSQIEAWVNNTPHDFIDIFHVPMGWNTPLFQRFQHLSLQAGSIGGISFYGAHPLVDKDIEICKFITPTLCIINLDNYEVKRKLFEFLDHRSEQRVIRLQSIDLATTKEELEAYLTKGYKIVYEYIDEITPQITGNIPKFVLERHDYTMKNEQITVIATSDKLFEQVKPYRSKNMDVITNGVDLQHWSMDKNKMACPADIKEIVDQGKIIIGYHGAFAQWIDYEVLKTLASDGRFNLLLIGYEHDGSLKSSGLLSYENVHFIGSKPYEELNKYAVFYDIAILPFLLNDITKSVSPVKIFEYMALKKPIVTYALPECLKYQSCLIAYSQDEFIDGIHQAIDLKENEDYLKTLGKEAEENTWQRVAELTFDLAFNNDYTFPSHQIAQASIEEITQYEENKEKRRIQEGKGYQAFKRLFWNMPFLSDERKMKMMFNLKSRYFPDMLSYNGNATPTNIGASVPTEAVEDAQMPKSFKVQQNYIQQVLNIPSKNMDNHIPLTQTPYVRTNGDSKILAYYLTQFHPDKHNEIWWGKGVTEWDNVARAVPQYIDHYQPRLPGELGFYDLRIKENMQRQIELAQMYGIYGFSFYYYWFDGERLLEKPIEMFLEDRSLDFPFSLCWANENWTKRFDGTNSGILMEQPKSIESYKNVIHDIIRFLKDARYVQVNGKKVLTIYRPSLMPEPSSVLEYWREFCRKSGAGELHIIAVKENMVDTDWIKTGYDALSEFHPGTLYTNAKNITSDLDYANEDFAGEIFDYKDLVENQKYFNYNYPKLYRAVMPMWDNTARRNNKGMIFHGSTPELYKQWLKDVMREEKEREDLEDELVFINAWNEWGEGAYLEPDKKYGYAYLQATKEAIEEVRLSNKK